MVTYLIPIVGLVLGVLVLNEALSWRIVAGGFLTIGGTVMVNVKPAAG